MFFSLRKALSKISGWVFYRMAEDVKYVCSNCEHAERFTKQERVVNWFKGFFVSLILLLGFVLLFFMVVAKPIPVLTNLATSFMVDSTVDADTHDLLRYNATRFIASCHRFADFDCYARQVYLAVNDTPYVQASLLSPMQSPVETLKRGGDCKNTAIMYVSLLQSIGTPARVSCDFTRMHCVSVVPLSSNDSIYYVVDLTFPALFQMNDSQEVWSYLDDGKWLL